MTGFLQVCWPLLGLYMVHDEKGILKKREAVGQKLHCAAGIIHCRGFAAHSVLPASHFCSNFPAQLLPSICNRLRRTGLKFSKFLTSGLPSVLDEYKST